MVLPRRGLTGQDMGLHQAEKPLLGEKGVRPATIVHPAAMASTFDSFPQDAPQTVAYPTVEHAEDPRATMLEVHEPATKRPVQRPNDRAQRLAVRPRRLRAN